MRVDETRKKEHFVLRNDTLRFENPEHFVLLIIHPILLANRERGEQKTVPVAQCTDTAIDVWYTTDYLGFNPQKR